MDIKVLIAMHKKYWVPRDSVYLPLHVGKRGKQDDWRCTGDDSGDNITEKNPYYCELTGLYWAWKNLDCEYIGLCHYRRYFIKKNLGLKIHINQQKDYEEAMQQADVLLPPISTEEQTVFEQYAGSHHGKDMVETGRIIEEFCPEYKQDFDDIMSGHQVYFWNMFCMKKELFNQYCEWLFTILFELEKRIDISQYDDYQKRVFGFVGERLFSVWLHHQDLKILNQEVMALEKNGMRRKITRWIQEMIY